MSVRKIGELKRVPIVEGDPNLIKKGKVIHIDELGNGGEDGVGQFIFNYSYASTSTYYAVVMNLSDGSVVYSYDPKNLLNEYIQYEKIDDAIMVSIKRNAGGSHSAAIFLKEGYTTNVNDGNYTNRLYINGNLTIGWDKPYIFRITKDN